MFCSEPDSGKQSPIPSQSSKLSSLPASFDYDTDTLKTKLDQHGFTPGPITKTTKRVYLRKLYKLQKQLIILNTSAIVPTQKGKGQSKLQSYEKCGTLGDL